MNRQTAKNLTIIRQKDYVFNRQLSKIINIDLLRVEKFPTSPATKCSLLLIPRTMSITKSVHFTQPYTTFSRRLATKCSQSRRGDITQRDLILLLEALSISQWLRLKCLINVIQVQRIG